MDEQTQKARVQRTNAGPPDLRVGVLEHITWSPHDGRVGREVSSNLAGPSLVCLWALYTLAKGEGSDIEDGSYE